MAEYEKVFENPYPNGWENLPSENTPITASALQEHTDAIENIEQYLEDNPIGGGGTDVQWDQIQESGTKIAEITIDGESQDIFAPSGGGSSSDDLSGTKAEFEAIKDSLPDGSAFDTIDESGGGSSSSESYSTEEQVIGTYLGKPLYRKVVNISLSGSSTQVENDTTHEYTKFSGVLKNPTGNKMQVGGYASSSNYSACYTNVSGALYLYHSSSYSNGSASVILEYTKTTD